MKIETISDLISLLQQTKKEHGDLQIYTKSVRNNYFVKNALKYIEDVELVVGEHKTYFIIWHK